MQNFEVVSDIFTYLLQDEEIDINYVRKLYYDSKVALMEEDIVTQLMYEPTSNIAYMMILDKGTRQLIVIER